MSRTRPRNAIVSATARSPFSLEPRVAFHSAPDFDVSSGANGISSYGGRRPTFSPVDLKQFTELSRDSHQELKLDLASLDSEFLRKFLQNLGAELSPVAAFLGGSLAQDVINVLSAREQPLQNMLLFDGEKSIGPIYPLHPFFPSDMGMASLAAVPPVGNPIPVNGDAS